MQSQQITAAFDSIWVSEEYADRVVRLDPDSGEVQATIDVGDAPFRMQPADGSLWVRTDTTYVEVDPETNEVTRTLAKADVGPAANRSWAVDGALWICDGQQLHRYDPADLALVATIDLQLECDEVWASADLVVASSLNEDPGESGTSAAAFVDPAANSVLATVALPFDVGGPAVLPQAVFFAGYLGESKGAVVDRATWTVSATPDLGVASGGSPNLGLDGDSIYVVTQDSQSVLRVDSDTFTVTGTIEPLGVNAVLVDDGALWIAGGVPYDVVQRFDLDD
jgi:streptogramin lyase